MTHRGKYLGALLVLGAVGASLSVAPVAGATATCQDVGSMIRCETNGSVSIKAVPTTLAPHTGAAMPGRRGVVMSW